jgi:Holliday junction resolvasome RuvABC endonuclease subunit
MEGDYTVLSLDLGTHCGWCLIKNGTVSSSGIVDLPASESHPGHRFLKFRNWLQDFKKVDEVFYEDVPRFESAKAARVYCGLLCIVQMFCLVHAKRMTNIKANSVKKEFTGHGNADKKKVCEVAHKLGWTRGHPSTDIHHDEADAIACAWVIMQRRGVELKVAV